MAILTTDFAHVTDDLQEIFKEVSKNAIAESYGMKLFNVKESTRKTYDHLIIHGLAGVQKVAEGADFPAVTSVEGDFLTWTQSQYAALISITKQARIFDLYDVIENQARTIIDDGYDKIDQSLADVLTNGFSSSNYTDVYGESVSATGYDGLALFSASHTNNINSNTFSNLIVSAGVTNPTLSREAIAAGLVQGLKYEDPNGIMRPIRYDTLLVAPSKEDAALRAVMSGQMPGSAENDTNMYLKGKLKVEVWERLETRTGGTDTSAYWFLADSNKVKETLHAIFAQKPQLDPPDVVYKNKNWDYSFDYLYSIGRGFSPYLRGSNASLS